MEITENDAIKNGPEITDNGIIEDAQEVAEVSTSDQKERAMQALILSLKQAFSAAKFLEGHGVVAMLLVKQGIIGVADQLPNKATAHELRADVFGGSNNAPQLSKEGQPVVRKRAGAPVYPVGPQAALKPVVLDDKSAQEVVSRFAAPSYIATSEEKKSPLVVSDKDKVTSEEGVVVEAGEPKAIPTTFLGGSVTIEQLRGTNAEALAANLKFAELVEILEELGQAQGKSRSKAAIAARIMQALETEKTAE